MKRSSARLAFSIALQNNNNGQTIRARVYLPRRRTRTDALVRKKVSFWVARYIVNRDGKSFRREASGDDWLQALLMATEGIRKDIPTDDSQNWTTAEGVPSWIILPRLVPISWGLELYKEVVEYIERKETEAGENARKKGETKNSK